MKNKYDVIIAGGGTAGCACAYIAGKLGLKVLLVEKNNYLGGSITSSLVFPAMKTSENAINTDFFNDLYSNLEMINGAITYCDGNKGWFNPELTKIILDKMLKGVGVDIKFSSYIKSIKKKNKLLLPYNVTIYENNNLFSNNGLLVYNEAKYIVDATGDAKICELLNCEFLENKNKNQPINLRFNMSGVDAKVFAEWISNFDKNRDVTTVCKIGDYTYFSTAYTWDTAINWALRPLFEDAIAKHILKEEDTNYFQIFSVAGTPDSVGFNCPRIIYADLSYSDALIKGRESILRLSVFCKKYLPGFEKAYISNIANSLGVRVSRRVKGKYVYTKDDLINGKEFDYPVVISSYPIDIHSDKKNSSVLQKINHEYQLPLDSLIVKDDLFVIGRCLSAEYEAQAALRIIPSCFSMGEGVAKYIASLM